MDLGNIMEIIQKLAEFSGKRNAVLTFFFPPNAKFHQIMKSMHRQISAIRHKNKRQQIYSVIKYIEEQNEDILDKSFWEYGYSHGVIICGAFDKSHRPVYEFIESPILITDFEYYYGYQFQMERIKELMFGDVIDKIEFCRNNESISDLLQRFENHFEMLVVGEDEINYTLENKYLEKIFVRENYEIDLSLISKSKEAKTKIVKFTKPSENKKYKTKKKKNENENTIEQQIHQFYIFDEKLKDLGDKLGLLRFPIDLRNEMDSL